MLANARELRHLVLHEHDERDIDRERDEREQRGDERDEGREERERHVGREREKERDERHSGGCTCAMCGVQGAVCNV